MRSPWWKWALPLTLVVLLGAVTGGLLLQRVERPALRDVSPAQPTTQENSGITEIAFTPDARAHPDSAKIHWTLQLHFNSINMRQYDSWKNTVVAERQRDMPKEAWQRAYATTRDSAVEVHRIEPGPDNSLRLLLTFISTQNPADAPPGMNAPCLRWHAVYPVVLESGAFRVDTTPPGAAIAQPC